MKFTYILLIMILGNIAIAQVPDFAMDSLKVIKGASIITGPSDIQASAQVFCDGKNISVVVRVKDNSIEKNRGNFHTDHVELYLALPKKAFPNNFEHYFHPYYVYAPSLNDRSGDNSNPHRFFSTYSEYTPALSRKALLAENQYPDSETIIADALRLPKSESMHIGRVDYGLVRIGFFPDGRRPIHYNKRHYKLLEENLGANLGDFVEGVQYAVDQYESEYVINIQLSPIALGFVELPEMNELRLAIDVIDTDFKFKKGTTVLSTNMPNLGPGTARFYTNISLAKALQTNFTEVPNRVYKAASFHPIAIYTTQGWITSEVDVDALAFRPGYLSKSITEINFGSLRQKFSRYMNRKQLLSFEQLKTNHQSVNALDRQKEISIINGRLFERERVKPPLEVFDSNTGSQIFTFPDGTAGFISVANDYFDRNGWGDCGKCLDERIQIFRINNPLPLLSIDQGEGKSAYCQIGSLSFPGFFVQKINWATQGKSLVLHLKHRKEKTRKRVLAQWGDDGNSVEVLEI